MSDCIRILCVFSTLDRGGSESMCMNLYRHIDREKVQFDFVKHTSQKGLFEDEIVNLGGRIFEAPRYLMYNHISYIHWWNEFFKNHPEYHIIHGHFFTISSVFLKVARKNGLITIGHSHCTPSNKKGIKETLSNYLVHGIEKRSDYCFACSIDAGKWVFKKKQFEVLKNAIDAKKFKYSLDVRTKVRKEFGFTDELVIGTVGRIMHQKNPLGIVEIFKNVHDKNANTKLLWIGNGNMRNDAENKIKEYGLSDSIIFTGVRDDVERLMQAMDVFIFPSFYEGLPVVAIEAQAAGLPCLCSNQVPSEAAITNLCLFISLDNYQIWADKILSINIERKDTYQQVVDADYDIHTTAKWLQDFYIRILKDNK